MRRLLEFLNRPTHSGNFFPRWSNGAPLRIIFFLVLAGALVTAAVNEYATNKYLNVGYTPDQPVAFDHGFHVGVLGLDCRYCHTNVEKSPHSNVPATSTCWNCHSVIKKDAPTIAPIRESMASGAPIQWVKVHKVPDYVYFPHSVHVSRGVSCVECHGRVDQMEVVGQQKPLSMSFCLDCHRNPEFAVRPVDKVTDLAWSATTPAAQVEQGTKFVHDWKIAPPQSCSGCHR
jgi:hypothetical protein